MNIISSSQLRSNFSDTLKKIRGKKEFVLVSHRGKLDSAIVDIDLFEDLLELRNPKYIESIKEAREQAKRGKVYTFDQVFGNIDE